MDSLLHHVLRIPHLDLGITFDLNLLLNDLTKVDEYVPYQSVYKTDINDTYYEEAWSGRSLSGFNSDSKDGMYESVGFKLKYNKSISGVYETDLVKTCPNLAMAAKTIIQSLTLARVRLFRIAPKKSLAWHSHCLTHGQNIDILTVQVPIIMPENFIYSVTYPNNLISERTESVIDTSRCYEATYKAGKAYVFNSFFPHNVFNRSHRERIALMMYGNISKNSHFRSIVEKAVNNYSGPLMDNPNNYISLHK